MARNNRNRNPQSTSKTTLPSRAPVALGGAARRRKKKKTSSSRSLPAYVALMANPVSAPLEGAHPPDANTRPTVLWRTSQAKTVTVPATKTAAVWDIFPSTKSGWATNVVTSDALEAVTSGDWDDYASLASSFYYHRPLALAVEIEYIGPADQAQGVIFACESDIILPTGTTLAQLTDEPHYAEGNITNGDTASAIIRYGSMPWTLMTSATTQVNEVPRVYVGVTGVLASSAYRIKATLVEEYTCLASSLLSTQAAVAPHHPQIYGAGRSIMGRAATVDAENDSMSKLLRKGRELAEQAVASHGVGALQFAYEMLMSKIANSTGPMRLTNG